MGMSATFNAHWMSMCSLPLPAPLHLGGVMCLVLTNELRGSEVSPPDWCYKPPICISFASHVFSQAMWSGCLRRRCWVTGQRRISLSHCMEEAIDNKSCVNKKYTFGVWNGRDFRVNLLPQHNPAYCDQYVGAYLKWPLKIPSCQDDWSCESVDGHEKCWRPTGPWLLM